MSTHTHTHTHTHTPKSATVTTTKQTMIILFDKSDHATGKRKKEKIFKKIKKEKKKEMSGVSHVALTMSNVLCAVKGLVCKRLTLRHTVVTTRGDINRKQLKIYKTCLFF